MKETILTNDSWIDQSELQEIEGKPLLLHVDTRGASSMEWITTSQKAISQLISNNGALLIRGLKIHSSNQFGKVLSLIFDAELLEYTYRSTPRTQLRGHVYTATEYPDSEIIPQHNENSYSRNWPGRIGFLCLLPPTAGGETPISDSRLIRDMLPEAVVKNFREKGVMYVRNYSDLDIPWTTVFQTDDKSLVEKYCVENEMEFEWLKGDGLRTKQVNPAFVTHPLTGEEVWFNQAHLFHVTNLHGDLSGVLMDSLGEENLPRNSYYGDGSAISPEILAMISQAYEKTKIKFTWEKGDLLLLDNVLFSHGRESYSCDRKVLTGMACPNRFGK